MIMVSILKDEQKEFFVLKGRVICSYEFLEKAGQEQCKIAFGPKNKDEYYFVDFNTKQIHHCFVAKPKKNLKPITGIKKAIFIRAGVKVKVNKKIYSNKEDIVLCNNEHYVVEVKEF